MEKSIISEKLKKMTEDQIQTALFAGLAFFALAFPVAKYYWPYYVRANQVQAIFLVVMTVYFLVVLGIEYQNKKIPYGNVPALAVIGMTVFGLISSLLNGDLTNSLYGDEFQGVGLITMVGYYALFFAGAHLKKKSYRRWLFLLICLELSFIVVYGILQFFQVPFMFHNVIKAAILPTRNQNFYAAFPVLFLGLIFGKILYDEKRDGEKKSSIILLHGLVMLGYGACIGSDSLVAYMGLMMQFVLMIFLECFRKKKHWKSIFLFVVEFAIVFFVFNLASEGQAKEEVFSLTNEIRQEGTVFGDSVGTLRMKIWKETLELISEDWAFGCGIEKFRVNRGTELFPDYVTDAHNEYLQVCAEKGTFFIVCYLVFLFALFIPGVLQFIKKERYDSDLVSKAALFAFFGYIAQAFANIRVIQVAPYFWLCCGLLYVRNRKKSRTENENPAS